LQRTKSVTSLHTQCSADTGCLSAAATGTSLASDIWIWSWEKATPVASQQGQTHWSVNKNQTVMHLQYMYRVALKLEHFVLYALTSSTIDRFSNLFHCLNQENMCNNMQ